MANKNRKTNKEALAELKKMQKIFKEGAKEGEPYKKTSKKVLTDYRIRIPFLKWGFFPKPIKELDAVEPLLFLLRDTGDIEIYENAKPGLFTYKSSSLEKKEDYLMVTPSRMRNLKYNDTDTKAYIGTEGELFCEPNDIIIDSYATVNMTKQYIAEEKEMYRPGEKLENVKAILLLVGGALAIVGVMWYYNVFGLKDFLAQYLPAGAQAANTIANTTASNSSISVIE